MTKLRPIKPMSFPDVTPATAFGKPPEVRWVDPKTLFVDATYQRELSERSIRLIRSVIASFKWNRFELPTVVETEGRQLHIIDGQHTAIAAATLSIALIPVLIVEAETLAERARAFVGHNVDRVQVSPFDIYQALLASGDPDAQDIANVCARAGVRLRQFAQTSRIEPGDTKALGLIRRLVKKRGVQKARKVLQCLAEAKLAPIPGGAITAVENLFADDKDLDFAALARIILADGESGLGKARGTASRERIAYWRVLYDRWAKRLQLEKVSAA